MESKTKDLSLFSYFIQNKIHFSYENISKTRSDALTESFHETLKSFNHSTKKILESNFRQEQLAREKMIEIKKQELIEIGNIKLSTEKPGVYNERFVGLECRENSTDNMVTTSQNIQIYEKNLQTYSKISQSCVLDDKQGVEYGLDHLQNMNRFSDLKPGNKSSKSEEFEKSEYSFKSDVFEHLNSNFYRNNVYNNFESNS